MADKTGHDEQLERVMNHLANSILELSDEEILAETDGTGTPPEQAERTRAVLRDVTRLLEGVNQRLLQLGHTISPQRWQQHGEHSYRNHCLTCNLSVSFTSATGEIWGSAVEGPCPQTERFAVRRRTASGR
jgi:hypothetical protein